MTVRYFCNSLLLQVGCCVALHPLSGTQYKTTSIFELMLVVLTLLLLQLSFFGTFTTRTIYLSSKRHSGFIHAPTSTQFPFCFQEMTLPRRSLIQSRSHPWMERRRNESEGTRPRSVFYNAGKCAVSLTH